MKRLTVLLLVFFATITGFAADSTFHFTTSDNVQLYVRVAGKGKPCLFLHGGPGSTSYYFEAFPGAAIIEQQMQMIYFDQRGCGRSGSAANNDYSLPRMMQDMEELRLALGHKKWSVMGHSFGGILITNYAAHYPKSVSALYMLHGTVNMQYSMQSHINFGVKQLGLTDTAALFDNSKPVIERVMMVHDELNKQNAWYKLMYRNATEKEINDSVTMSAGNLNWEFAQKVWNVEGYWTDFAPLTAQIKCPVLVITGDQDYAIGTEHYQSFRFPKQKVIHYIGGHASFQEEPQWFAEKILGFYKKHIK